MSSKENYFSTKKYGRFNCIYFLGFKLYCFTLSLSLSDMSQLFSTHQNLNKTRWVSLHSNTLCGLM